MGAIIGLLLGVVIIVMVVCVVWSSTSEGNNSMGKFFKSKPKSEAPKVLNMGVKCVNCDHRVGFHAPGRCGVDVEPGYICACKLGREEAAEQADLYGESAIDLYKRAVDLSKEYADSLETEVKRLRKQVLDLRAENAELQRTQYPQDKVV